MAASSFKKIEQISNAFQVKMDSIVNLHHFMWYSGNGAHLITLSSNKVLLIVIGCPVFRCLSFYFLGYVH
jgi:hypothetical protein